MLLLHGSSKMQPKPPPLVVAFQAASTKQMLVPDGPHGRDQRYQSTHGYKAALLSPEGGRLIIRSQAVRKEAGVDMELGFGFDVVGTRGGVRLFINAGPIADICITYNIVVVPAFCNWEMLLMDV
ncbi:hypothetical protein DY000_02011788 [Brassica cretica]|uniref:Uncharacterized protein n=1 Tax=Brassica cretica TaxID=69181 RepID=A0ABQ7D1L0_BRACR|nr:hypothetical protein DY000_02011788 [Brassica cretica]